MAANGDDKGIMQARDKKGKALLEEKKGAVDRIAKRLLEVETLGEEEFKALPDAPATPPLIPSVTKM